MSRTVKFKEYKSKDSNGKIEIKKVAYFSATSKARNIFGSDLVKEAIIVVDEYDEKIGSEEEWKECVKSSKYNIGNREVMNLTNSVAYVTFNNGETVRFYTSDLGSIRKTDEIKEEGEDMNRGFSVCILGSDKGWGKKFMDLCDKLSIPSEATKEDFINAGFRNLDDVVFTFYRALHLKDKYPVSLTIRAVQKNKETIVLTDIDVLDENFLQPHFVDEQIYQQCEEYFHMLKNKNVLSIC